MLSNGPGDPQDIPHAHETVRKLLGKVPIFGICMGHQVIGLACGAKTFKLKSDTEEAIILFWIKNQIKFLSLPKTTAMPLTKTA